MTQPSTREIRQLCVRIAHEVADTMSERPDVAEAEAIGSAVVVTFKEPLITIVLEVKHQ